MDTDSSGFSSSVYSDVSTQTMDIDMVLDGWTFASKEEIKLDYLTFQLTGLYSWLRETGIRSNSKNDFKGFTMDCEFLDPVRMFSCGNFHVDVGFRYINPKQKPDAGEWGIREVPVLSLVFIKNVGLSEAFVAFRRVLAFMSLFFGRPIFGHSFRGRLSGLNVKIRTRSAGKQEYYEHPANVEILTKVNPEVYEKDSEYSGDCVVSYKETKQFLERVSERFFSNYEVFKPVIELFVNTRYLASKIPLEQEVLNQAQVLEAFHRRCLGRDSEVSSISEERLSRVLASCSEEDREWLAGTLSQSGKPTFRDRVNDVWRELDYVTQRFPMKRKSFSHKVGLLRNYYTHYNEQIERELPDVMKVIQTVFLLRLLNELMILKTIGFPRDVVCEHAEKKIKSFPVSCKRS